MRIIAPIMQGWHLTAELHGCAPAPAHIGDTAGGRSGNTAGDLMRDVTALRRLCVDAVHAAGLTAVGELFHPFPAPGGITGVVLLVESHLAVHTWPELNAVTLDVYVCNVSGNHSQAANALMDALILAFAPRDAQRRAWHRGAVQG